MRKLSASTLNASGIIVNPMISIRLIWTITAKAITSINYTKNVNSILQVDTSIKNYNQTVEVAELTKFLRNSYTVTTEKYNTFVNNVKQNINNPASILTNFNFLIGTTVLNASYVNLILNNANALNISNSPNTVTVNFNWTIIKWNIK
jgi:hypothetical protein